MAQLCLPRLYLRLATCFMATGDASIAADVYSSCLDSSSDGSGLTAAGGAGLLGQFGGTEVPARCATSWLGLGVANYRLGEYRCVQTVSMAGLSALPRGKGFSAVLIHSGMEGWCHSIGPGGVYCGIKGKHALLDNCHGVQPLFQVQADTCQEIRLMHALPMHARKTSLPLPHSTAVWHDDYADIGCWLRPPPPITALFDCCPCCWPAGLLSWPWQRPTCVIQSTRVYGATWHCCHWHKAGRGMLARPLFRLRGMAWLTLSCWWNWPMHTSSWGASAVRLHCWAKPWHKGMVCRLVRCGATGTDHEAPV